MKYLYPILFKQIDLTNERATTTLGQSRPVNIGIEWLFHTLKISEIRVSPSDTLKGHFMF